MPERSDYRPAPDLPYPTNGSNGWGVGYPHCQPDRLLTAVRSDGVKVSADRLLTPLFMLAIDITERFLEYDVIAGETWSASCRIIRGSTRRWTCPVCGGVHTGTPSNHSKRRAVDINAPRNPMLDRFVSDMPPSMPKLWDLLGFGWGGDYTGRPDPMHYEFNGRPIDAPQMVMLARNILESFEAIDWATPVDPAKVGPDLPASNSTRRVQNRLAVDWSMRHYPTFIIPDGDVGPLTLHALEHFQRVNGLTVDQQFGPETAGAMGITLAKGRAS